jgi:zinc-finger of transposase IS204/IS1001/IS1096/IS1165
MQEFEVSELVPRGFVVESATKGDGDFVIAIRGAATVCRCPMCSGICSRVHSQYRRRLADLPAAGVRIALILRMRRFFCDDLACERRIFAERFEAVGPRARRTSRLDDVIHCLAIALGGRPAASLSRRLNVKVSNDTLLRMVRRRGPRSFPPPAIVGIDDWLGGAIIATARWSATLSGMRQSLSCSIGSQPLLKPGWHSNRKSVSSLAIVEVATRSRRGGRFRTRSRSPTGGI